MIAVKNGQIQAPVIIKDLAMEETTSGLSTTAMVGIGVGTVAVIGGGIALAAGGGGGGGGSSKPEKCEEGYTLTDGKCVPNACEGYVFSSCPDRAECDSCQSGSKTKYKITGCTGNYYGEHCENAPLSCQNGGRWKPPGTLKYPIVRQRFLR